MVTCSVSGCKNKSGRTPNVRYYRFPKDEKMIAKWLEACNLPPEARAKFKNLRVCSVHFKDSDYKEIPEYLLNLPNYEIPRNGRQIVSDAIPSQYLPLPTSTDMNTIKIHQKSEYDSLNERTIGVRLQSQTKKYSSLPQHPKQILQTLSQNQVNELSSSESSETSILKYNSNPCHWEHNYCQFSLENSKLKEIRPKSNQTLASTPTPVFLYARPINSRMRIAKDPVNNLSSSNRAEAVTKDLLTSITPGDDLIAIKSNMNNLVLSRQELKQSDCKPPASKIIQEGNNNIILRLSSKSPMAPRLQIINNNIDKSSVQVDQTAENQKNKSDPSRFPSCELSSASSKISQQQTSQLIIKVPPVTSTVPRPDIHANKMDKSRTKARQAAQIQHCKPGLCGSTSCQLSTKKALRAKDVVILKLINTIKRLQKVRRSEVNAEIRERLQHIFSPKQIQKMLNPGKRVTWSNEDIDSAMALKNISIKAYKHLRGKNYPLPSLNSLAVRRHLIKIDSKNIVNIPKSIQKVVPTQNR